MDFPSPKWRRSGERWLALTSFGLGGMVIRLPGAPGRHLSAGPLRKQAGLPHVRESRPNKHSLPSGCYPLVTNYQRLEAAGASEEVVIRESGRGMKGSRGEVCLRPKFGRWVRQ